MRRCNQSVKNNIKGIKEGKREDRRIGRKWTDKKNDVEGKKASKGWNHNGSYPVDYVIASSPVTTEEEHSSHSQSLTSPSDESCGSSSTESSSGQNLNLPAVASQDKNCGLSPQEEIKDHEGGIGILGVNEVHHLFEDDESLISMGEPYCHGSEDHKLLTSPISLMEYNRTQNAQFHPNQSWEHHSKSHHVTVTHLP